MTTNKVVADGRSEAEVRGLVQAKANEIVRRIIDDSVKLDPALEGIQLLIEGLDIKKEMVYIPLEWTGVIGKFSLENIYQEVDEFNRGFAFERDVNKTMWRIPNDKELSRLLRKDWSNPWTYFWTSTPHFDGHGVTVTCRHTTGLSSRSHLRLIPEHLPGGDRPSLILCREMKLD